MGREIPLVLLALLIVGPALGQEPENGFSPLDEITPGNGGRLAVAFTFRTGAPGAYTAAPRVAVDLLLVLTPFPHRLFALDWRRPGAPLRWEYAPAADEGADLAVHGHLRGDLGPGRARARGRGGGGARRDRRRDRHRHRRDDRQRAGHHRAHARELPCDARACRRRFFRYPEVYIIFVPAVGMVSIIVGTFSRRPVFGYLPLVLALVTTGILAFFVTFVIGGLSGVMVASVPLDTQLHDSYFAVAHFTTC